MPPTNFPSSFSVIDRPEEDIIVDLAERAIDENDSDVVGADMTAPIAKRQYNKTANTKNVPAALESTIITSYTNGDSVNNIAKAHNLSAILVRTFLVAQNIQMRPKGRVRSTVEITGSIVKAAMDMINTGSGVVAAAKALNVNPSKLSDALKARNIIIAKGRRKAL